MIAVKMLRNISRVSPANFTRGATTRFDSLASERSLNWSVGRSPKGIRRSTTVRAARAYEAPSSLRDPIAERWSPCQSSAKLRGGVLHRDLRRNAIEAHGNRYRDWGRPAVSAVQFLLWLYRVQPYPALRAFTAFGVLLLAADESRAGDERFRYVHAAELCEWCIAVEKQCRTAIGLRASSESWLIGLSSYEDRKGHRERWKKLRTAYSAQAIRWMRPKQHSRNPPDG